MVIGEWADAIDNNKPPTDDIDDPAVRMNLASLFADQVSMFVSAAARFPSSSQASKTLHRRRRRAPRAIIIGR